MTPLEQLQQRAREKYGNDLTQSIRVMNYAELDTLLAEAFTKGGEVERERCAKLIEESPWATAPCKRALLRAISPTNKTSE
jgi:hypothetical protein